MTINQGALADYLDQREEEGFVEEVEANYIDRLVHTENGVAKIRELEEQDKPQEIYDTAENNLEALRELDIDHINTSHALLEDYRGEDVLAIFQPYTEEPDVESDKWVETISEAADKGVNLDPKLENFGVQYSQDGDEIKYGLRDVSDPVSVYGDSEIAQELGLTSEEELFSE